VCQEDNNMARNRNTRRALCPNCSTEDNFHADYDGDRRSVYTRDFCCHDGTWDWYWRCCNCLHTVPVKTRAPRPDLTDAKANDWQGVTPDEAYTRALALALETGAPQRQAKAVAEAVRSTAERAGLRTGDEPVPVDIGDVECHAIGRKLMVWVGGVCRSEYATNAYGRIFSYRLDGLVVGERGATKYTDNGKKYRGWKAVLHAINS
jgi:hypothetical protein